MDKNCNLSLCVDICLLDSEEYIQVLTYRSPCNNKTESFFAFFPELGYILIIVLLRKVFEHSHYVFLLSLS